MGQKLQLSTDIPTLSNVGTFTYVYEFLNIYMLTCDAKFRKMDFSMKLVKINLFSIRKNDKRWVVYTVYEKL